MTCGHGNPESILPSHLIRALLLAQLILSTCTPVAAQTNSLSYSVSAVVTGRSHTGLEGTGEPPVTAHPASSFPHLVGTARTAVLEDDSCFSSPTFPSRCPLYTPRSGWLLAS